MELSISDCGEQCFKQDTTNDSSADVGGDLISSSGRLIKDVEVSLLNEERSLVENFDGSYLFQDVPMFDNYLIRPYKNNDVLEGVSTLDLILIQNHILGISPFTEAYQLIAADVNLDGKISASDLIELRNVIIRIQEQFNRADSWTFLPMYLLNDNFSIENRNQNHILIQDLKQDRLQEDFLGVKMGDINLSNINDSGVFTRSSRSDKIPLEITISQEDRSHFLRFALKNSDELRGFQLFLDFGDLEIISMHFPDLISKGEYKIDDNSVHYSWSEPYEVLAANSEILEVITREYTGVSLKHELTLDQALGISEVYFQDLAHKEMILIWKDSKDQSQGHELKISPNPFHSQTMLSLNLLNSATVHVQVFDVAGKVVYKRSEFMEKGHGNLEITNQDITNEGIYLCSVRIGDQLFNRKIVFSK